MRYLVSLLISVMLTLGFGFSCSAPSDTEIASETFINMKLQRVQTFDGFHKGDFSSDGKLLALVSQSHTDVIEIATGRKLSSIAPTNALFLGARFSTDGRLLATAYRIETAGRQSEIHVTL